MKITWFGHSAFRLETAKSVILIDPFITHNPVATVKADAAGRGATHVVVTHGHEDHVGDAESICKANGAMLIAVHEICEFLGGKGVENCTGSNPGGTIYTTDFDVSFVRADHSSSYDGQYMGNPCGVVIRTREGKSVYHMGDTDIFGDMALINEIHRPTVGIVPIGDRYTMNPRTAALACRRFFQFETIIPCHYKTFPVLVQSPDKFIEELGGDGAKVKAMKPGESLTL
jgi:L-ascorbate metabolism protein UlaG (beta-lactamase superfamily)